ncbi:MAG: acetyl esterase [Acidimicrobiaceae bacterium]|nr:acetyl esterase [Acidimicrobiaceae bacterium]
MPLDPQAQVLLDGLAALDSPVLASLSPPEARELFRGMAALTPVPETARTEERVIPVDGGELTAHVFWPLGGDASGAPDAPPVLVYFHGGGWIVGDLSTSDSSAAELCNLSGCVVVNVDYRLAPEHAFPGPLEDAYAAVRWVVDNGESLGADPTRLAVGGDSAGANLSTAVCLLARDRNGPDIRFQLLLYPPVDGRRSYPSFRENAEGYFLTAETMDWFWGHYLGDTDPEDPLASPLYASDLAGLPPALVVTAEFDPLRDEGEAYAERLRQAGVIAHASRYDGQVHGFAGMFNIFDAGRKAMDEAARALRAAL